MPTWKATANIGPNVGGPTPGRSRCEANVQSRTPSEVKARPAMASLLVVRTSTDPPKRQVNRIRFGDHQATEVEFLALRSIDGPLIEPRNDFRRDILDDSPPIGDRDSRIRCPCADDVDETAADVALPPPCGVDSSNDHHEDARAVWQQTVGSAAMKFQVWACDLDGQEFDEDSSYTIHPVMTGVLTIHWADGRASHYSPAAWQRIEDQISGPVSGLSLIH